MFYLVLSTGVHVHIDTCCDIVQNTLMTALPIDCCASETEEMVSCAESSCGDHKSCPTEQIDIQLDEDFLANAPLIIALEVTDHECAKEIDAAAQALEQQKATCSGADPPPPYPVYILHSSLVYYG